MELESKNKSNLKNEMLATGMQRFEVVDLFCGVGGLTCGMQQAGFNVVAGFDNDETCEYAYSHNNHAKFNCRNIRNVSAKEIIDCYSVGSNKILVGCAPCQPFSTMSYKRFKNTPRELDEKYDLLAEFGRLVKEVKPTIVSMENVPEIRNSNVFKSFVNLLIECGYFTDNGQIVYCPDYGIPQNRHRFVLLASLLGEIHLLQPTHKRKEVCVRPYIENLPPVKAGEICETDPLHRTAKLSDINLRRIRASSPGGTWKDWPEELRCECHKKDSGQTYTSVYGRMSWDKIGPTITTQFFCYGTGRYGHPEQDRALTLREGALLQTFPEKYEFFPPETKDICMRDIARHIGNAVPVRLGEIIGNSIIKHLEKYKKEVR